MQYIKTRRRGLKEWEDIFIKLLLSLIFVIPIILMIVSAGNKVTLENEKESTANGPTIATPSQELTTMQSIPEETQIVTEAVLINKTATTKVEIMEIKYPAILAASAAIEEETNALEETEKTIEKTLETKKVEEHCTEKIANEVIVFSEESKLIHTIAKVIYAEACGEPLLGKVAVGATIVNRLNSEYFPNTIEEVLEGQFASYDWVTDEHLAQIPECVEAAERALMGEDPLAEELGEPTVYFLNPEKSDQKEVEFREKKKNATIGHHMFSGLSLYW